MQEPQGIYRGEVIAMMGALADINANVKTMVDYFLGGEDEEEDQETDA